MEWVTLCEDKWYIAKKLISFSDVLFNTCLVRSRRTAPVWELSRAVNVRNPAED